ncbi:MAG TPA: acyl-CoA dehydrogenase family protein [Thermoleophilaceae bacterium]
MTFLHEERRALERYLPGLDAELTALPLAALESPDSPAIELFREAGGPGLLVPRDHRGAGAGPLDAIRVQRAIGSRSPSLAVASTMHHFSVASLVQLDSDGDGGFEWMLLEAIADGRKLLASGFAEGVRGQDVFAPTMRGRRDRDRVLVSGRKKPCSLSRSMDLLTASVLVEGNGSGPAEELAVAVIAADAPGLEVEPFWGSSVLAGAQSDAVVLNDVPVEDELVFPLGTRGPDRLDAVQEAGFLWFALLMTASYLGVASALVERALLAPRGDASLRVGAAAELEAAAASLEGIAHRLAAGEAGSWLLTRALLCRYAAQDAIGRAVASAVEQLGGVAFVSSDDVNHLAGASRALALHPPARPRTADALADALGGAELRIG